MFDLIAEIRQTLRSNRLRTFLTGISVAWGVFMLILLLGVARGVANSFRARSGSMENSISVYGGRTTLPYRGYKDGRSITLRSGDREAILRGNNPGIDDVLPSASNDTAKIVGPRDYITGLTAFYPEMVESLGLELESGRMLNDRDIELNRRVIVLNDRNARLLFGDGVEPLGRTVNSMGVTWTVVGTYSDRWRRGSYIPFTTYRTLTGNSEDVERFYIRVTDIDTQEAAEAVEAHARAVLARTHQFDPADANAVWVWNSVSDYIAANKGMGYLNLAMWLIGLLTLVTGIVGVSNIMFVSVRERTHEIGIRRAIGAKPRAIVVQILAEGVSITALFGYMGVFAGMVILQIVDAVFADAEFLQNPTVDISIAVEVTVVLIVCGALAGLFPALKALKVKPVEALRDE